MDDLETLAPFSPADHLAITACKDGSMVLPVRIHTDISDADFLYAFERAVQSEWNESAAALQRRLSISLDWTVHSVAEMYPDEPPSPQQEIDVDAHVARCGEAGLIMTTGAASTHAWTGRRLLLGPEPITPRELAHEFGHLIGFNDAYLRGYDGRPGDPYGVVLVEWTGLVDDLMGNSEGGRVTAVLIDKLIEAYAGDVAPGDHAARGCEVSGTALQELVEAPPRT